MKKQKYYIGLDMGTSSVGWAVTDDSYHLIRRKGKDMWGIREFEEAKTSAERRTHRISRRRLQRSKVRIGLIKTYFDEEIRKIDPFFYERLDNSKYYPEDKDEKVKSPNGVFNDKEYTDKEYYKQYPTIFHLRKELINNENAPYDVRLVYLAVLNLFKRRGHFLNSSLKLDDESVEFNLKDAYSNMLASIEENLNEELSIVFPEIDSDDTYLELQNILGTREFGRKQKSEKVAKLLGIDRKQKKEMEIINGMVGLSVDCCRLFDIEAENKITAKFSDFGYAEKEPEILDQLGDSCGSVLMAVKTVYDIGSLTEILKGQKYLSFARVEDYEQHKNDLKKLKKVVKKYAPDQYDYFFRQKEDGTYSAYVNSVNTEKYNDLGSKDTKPNRRNMKARSRDDFYKGVKKLLKGMPADDADVIDINKKIENETFMPKQLTAGNGIIPNQLHAMELKKILDNASGYLGFLNDVDESGLTVKERIIRLYTFTFPYYVGPVSTNSKTGWVIRKPGYEKGLVLPWELDEKIDRTETAKCFIDRMVRRCTYLNDEMVMPKSSLKYERYCVLNEINNIRIDNSRIDNELKKRLFNELYLNGKKPSRKKIESFLYSNGVPKDAQITGVDKELNNALSSYGKFRDIFGDELEKDSVKKMVDDIIFRCTVYGDSKEFIYEYIQKNYPESEYPILNKKTIKRIIGFKFKDWGRFSEEMLDLQGCNYETGEVYSILTALWETNRNFIELINSESFEYKKLLEEKSKSAINSLSEVTPELLDEYYFSAPVKKMILQTMGVIKEIVQIMKCEPNRIFIEMTRSEGEKGDKGRKDSRKKALLELYKNINDELHDKNYWKDLIESADANGKLRSKRMYLYIKQMGMDMYTGEPIDLDYLFDENRYDIDHIYPRHFVKDDNLENNLVLVNKPSNAKKTDIYPIPGFIKDNPKVWKLWEMLHKRNLINDVKYARLRNNESFTDEQKAGFIARQLVETSQGTKGVADILKQVLPDTQVVYSKAGNVSRFRSDNKFYKSRLINDFHHANDAYLNIVVGNVYYTKFTSSPMNFIKNEYSKDAKKFEYNLDKMFAWKVERDGYTAWIPLNKGNEDIATIKTVEKMLAKNTPLLTRQSFVKSGVINKVTLYGKNTATSGAYIPLKMSDPKMQDVTKYGGYTSVNICYFFLVEHEKKGNKVRTIEALPGYLEKRVENDPKELEKYCVEGLGLENPSVRYRKIRIQSLFKVDGYYMHLSGKSANSLIVRNAVSLSISKEWLDYIHFIEKLNESEYKYDDDRISIEKNIELFDTLVEKHINGIYSKRPNGISKFLIVGKEKFLSLKKEEQCKVILQILQISAMGNNKADLSLIGGVSMAGNMQINKSIDKYEKFILVQQSNTGLFVNESVDLKTV